MSIYYKRLGLNRLEDFQTHMIENYVTTPIEPNITGDGPPLYKSFQPPEFLYTLLNWEAIQILTGSNAVTPGYFNIIGLPQQEYPKVEISKQIKTHVATQKEAGQLNTWWLLRLTMYVPIKNGADHTLELYDAESGQLVDSVALTTPIIVSNDLHVKSVINNPAGCWHVQFCFLTQGAYFQTGETLITSLTTAMKPVSVSFPNSQYLPD